MTIFQAGDAVEAVARSGLPGLQADPGFRAGGSDYFYPRSPTPFQLRAGEVEIAGTFLFQQRDEVGRLGEILAFFVGRCRVALLRKNQFVQRKARRLRHFDQTGIAGEHDGLDRFFDQVVEVFKGGGGRVEPANEDRCRCTPFGWREQVDAQGLAAHGVGGRGFGA